MTSLRHTERCVSEFRTENWKALAGIFNRKRVMYKYEGVCFDGPWRGKMYTHQWSYFRIAIAPYLAKALRDDPECKTMLDITYGEYRWSFSLNAWTYVY